MRGEFDFIANLKARAAAHYASTPELVLGIGDDALLWRERTGRDSVITTDLLIEDIDFRRTWMPPALLGHKALAVSLSDIAAMGATPRLCLISIGVPHDVWNSNFVEEFYDSLLALAAEHNVALGGGDISRTSDRIVVNSTVLGQSIATRRFCVPARNPATASSSPDTWAEPPPVFTARIRRASHHTRAYKPHAPRQTHPASTAPATASRVERCARRATPADEFD
jgi:thiamin-phosphate kinase